MTGYVALDSKICGLWVCRVVVWVGYTCTGYSSAWFGKWKNFWSPDFNDLAAQLSDKAIFDGRNLYEPDAVKAFELQYYAIGRGEQLA